MVAVVKMSNLGHFRCQIEPPSLRIEPKIPEIIKLDLKILLVAQPACFYHFSFRFEGISKMKGFGGQIAASILNFFTDINSSRLWMDQSA